MKRKVSDLLKEKGKVVFTIEDNKKLRDAVRMFIDKRVGALIVLNEDGDIQGIVTERDILKRLALAAGEIKGLSVKMVMTSKEKLIVGTPDDSIEYIMKVMTSNRIRHIPIVGGESQIKLEGLISIGDVVKAMLSDVARENKLLKDYIEGTYPV
jgi:CBS domain-containing protein